MGRKSVLSPQCQGMPTSLDTELAQGAYFLEQSPDQQLVALSPSLFPGQHCRTQLPGPYMGQIVKCQSCLQLATNLFPCCREIRLCNFYCPVWRVACQSPVKRFWAPLLYQTIRVKYDCSAMEIPCNGMTYIALTLLLFLLSPNIRTREMAQFSQKPRPLATEIATWYQRQPARCKVEQSHGCFNLCLELAISVPFQ